MPSEEKALVILAEAMNALKRPSMSKMEVTRLRSLIQARNSEVWTER